MTYGKISRWQKIKNIFNRSKGQGMREEAAKFGIITKASEDALRAEEAITTIMEEIEKEITAEDPSQFISELYDHTSIACGILVTFVFPMMRTRDNIKYGPRINLFNEISEGLLSDLLELSTYFQRKELEAKKIDEMRKETGVSKYQSFYENQRATNMAVAEEWRSTIKEDLYTKIKDIIAEAWGHADKTGIIHFEFQGLMPQDVAYRAMTGSGGPTSDDRVAQQQQQREFMRKPKGGPYPPEMSSEIETKEDDKNGNT